MLELFLLQLVERVLVEWPSSQLLDLALALIDSLLALLADGCLTAYVVA